MNRIHKKQIYLTAVMVILAQFTGGYGQDLSRNDISGTLKDAKSGEPLPYANIMIQGTVQGTTTNTDGYFVLVNVPVGPCSLIVRYIGYKSRTIYVNNRFGGIPPLAFELETEVLELEEITITAPAEMLESSAQQVSQVKVSPRELSTLPSIGEVDIFRALQLLPGISGASEGESGLYIRGSSPDQNLVLFDGMNIYHVDHFFGFFSAFNADAVKDVQVFKGGFPAQYGGRTSSVIDLTGKTGNWKTLRAGLGANLLSANGYLEIPIFGKGAFILTGRRSFTDFIQSALYDNIYNLVTGEESGSGRIGGGPAFGDRRGNMQTAEFKPSFYFYDINSKLTLAPTSKDILAMSFYSGRDDLDKSQDMSDFNFRFDDTSEDATMELKDYTRWYNLGASGKWSRQWSKRFHSDLLFSYSQYYSEYDRSQSMSGMALPNDSTAIRRGLGFASTQDNKVEDMTFRTDLTYHLSALHTLGFGTWISEFNSRYTATLNDSVTFLDRTGNAWLFAGYVQDNFKLYGAELNLGLRTSWYQGTEKAYFEPRASLNIPFFRFFNMNAAWGHYYQFVNRVVNENITEGGRDFWLLAEEDIQPGFAEHWILGVNYDRKAFGLGVEAYYKDMDHLLEFTRRFTGRRGVDEFFYTGSGRSYGIEFLAQKKRGMLTGWIGYTLGKVEHTFPAFNEGEPFPAEYDRRHEVNFVSRLTLGKWTVAATWVYATGAAYTEPVSQYSLTMLDGDVYNYIHVGDKNGARLPAYHRLDLSASYLIDMEFWTTEIGVSVFNLYNRKNVWYREYGLDTTPVTVTDAVLLGFTPTVYLKVNIN